VFHSGFLLHSRSMYAQQLLWTVRRAPRAWVGGPPGGACALGPAQHLCSALALPRCRLRPGTRWSASHLSGQPKPQIKGRCAGTVWCSRRIVQCRRAASYCSPCAQLTYEYQINQPPPLGHPECQFPELKQPGMCANMIVYIPSKPDAVRPGAPPVRAPRCGTAQAGEQHGGEGAAAFALCESACFVRPRTAPPARRLCPPRLRAVAARAPAPACSLSARACRGAAGGRPAASCSARAALTRAARRRRRWTRCWIR